LPTENESSEATHTPTMTHTPETGD